MKRPALSRKLRVAVDELRMQMLGTEVLFGFELEGTFKEGLAHLSTVARLLDFAALLAVVFMLAALIGAPAQHRLVERGNASTRLLRVIGRHAALALFFFAAVLGCDGFVVTEYYLGAPFATVVAIVVWGVALILWFIVGSLLKRKVAHQVSSRSFEETPLHEKIEQMLTEAWVVLPGATGIFGFQLLITMTPPFEGIPWYAQYVHFGALCVIALAIIILVMPAALQRIAFSGNDSHRCQRIGSLLITTALAPLALGVSADVYVAGGRLLGYSSAAVIAAVGVFCVLMFAWYALPLLSRPARMRALDLADPIRLRHET